MGAGYVAMLHSYHCLSVWHVVENENFVLIAFDSPILMAHSDGPIKMVLTGLVVYVVYV